jgi:uncharacterized protein
MSSAAPLPLYRERTPEGVRERFYAPAFQVKIAGRALPRDTVLDVSSVTYRDKVDDLDSFEFVVNNWDAQRRRFKYEPAALPQLAELFALGQRVELWMGYLNNLRRMLVGEITALQPNYPENAVPTLTVSGLNVLHGFRKKQHTHTWEQKTDAEIASYIAGQPLSDAAPGLGGIEIDVSNTKQQQPDEHVFMNNQYDIVFLLERARRRGFTLSLAVEPETGKPPKLIFGRSEAQRDVVYVLEWGKTLSSFRPTVQTANQVSKVVVKGWDRAKKEPIEGVAEFAKSASNLDWLGRIARATGDRTEEICDRPVRNQKEAEQAAGEILGDMSRRMVTAQAATVGLPDLRAGRKVHIKGFAPLVDGKPGPSKGSFDGIYYITESTHTIGEQGYRTTIGARREGELP